jgi:hypothetical protein
MVAVDWLELLWGDPQDLELETIFPGLADDEDQDYVNEVLLSGDLSLDRLQRLALDVISEVSGRPWWVTLRMISIAESKWSILGGDLVLRGIDAGKLSLSAWLDALWPIIFDRLPRDKWTMLSSMIEAVPPSETETTALESMEMSVDEFSNLMRG